MAWYIGQDRNDRPARLIDTWTELLPITEREAELLQAARRVEDMEFRREHEPNWDLASAEQLELSTRYAAERIVHPSSGWVILNPEEASLVKDALRDTQVNEPEGRYQRDCWALITQRFEHVK